MGMNAYLIKAPDTTSSQQQTEVVSPAATTGDLTTPTIEELSHSLQAVTQKVTVIQGRMTILESSFQLLIQKTAELMEELRLTHEQLANKTRDLVLLRMERSSTATEEEEEEEEECDSNDVVGDGDDDDLKEEVESLRIMDIGER